ncbi:MAG: ATP-binding protein [Candidatus Saccharimonadales bacterium]
MMKSLRVKHYSYLLTAVLLVVTSLANIVINLRAAQAEVGGVTITSPVESQEITQQTRQITGTAPALKQIAVFDGDSKIGSTTSSGSGAWSLAWEDPTPGQHRLRAVLVEGQYFMANTVGANAAQSFDLNSGQDQLGFRAGFSGSDAVVYDSTLQKSFVVNRSAGTISQVDPLSKEVESSFTYSSSLVDGAIMQGDSESAAILQATRCDLGQSLRSLCAYTYDQTNHRLYMLDFKTLYVINVQSKTVEASIDVGFPDAGLGFHDVATSAEYKLYIDPQRNYLYIYHDIVHYESWYGEYDDYNPENNKIIRVNLQSNTIDSSWSFSGSSVVVSADNDVFVAQVSQEETQNIYIQRGGAGELSKLELSTQDCNKRAAQLALSNNDNYLYAACTDASDQKKTVVINPDDGAVISSFEREGKFITLHNLTTQWLLSGEAATGGMRVLDTQSNTEANAIQGIAGVRQERSVVIDANSKKLYFATVDTPNAQNHLYAVDLETSGVEEDRTYPTTAFKGVRSATQTGLDQYMFLPVQPDDQLGSINLGNGSRQVITDGVGVAAHLVYARNRGKLYTLGNSDTGIDVSNALSGEFEGRINLPDAYTLGSGVLSPDESVLYVSATNYTDSLRIFAINTDTLQVMRIYDAADQYATTDRSALLGRLSLGGNMLAFLFHSKLFLFNLQSGALQQRDWVFQADQAEEGRWTMTESSPSALQALDLNSDGTELLILKAGDYLVKLSVDDLNTELSPIEAPQQRLMEIGAEVTADGRSAITSVKWGPSGSIFIGAGHTYKESFGYSKLYQIEQGGLLRSIDLISDRISGSISICFPYDIELLPDAPYAEALSSCMSSTSAGDGKDIKLSLYLDTVDLQSNVTVFSKAMSMTTESIATGTDSSDYIIATKQYPYGVQTNVQVAATTRRVIVKADAVTITAPSEGENVNQGMHTITGTAPPGAQVAVLVDQVAIGTAQSDTYGAWSLEYNFAATKTYEIVATSTKPDQDLLYLPQFGIDFQGKINLFSANTSKVVKTIQLPNNQVSLNAKVSKDGERLLVLSMTASNNSRAYLLTYGITSGELLSSVQLGSPPSDTPFLNGIFSSDETSVFLLNTSEVTDENPDDDVRPYVGTLSKIDSQTGQVLGSYQVEYEASNNESDFFSQMSIAEGINTVVANLGTQALTFNFQTGETGSFPSPTSNQFFSKILYDDQNSRIILALVNADDFTSTVGALSPDSGSPAWTVELPNTLLLRAGRIASDQQSLYLVGFRSASTATPQYDIYKFNLADGSYQTYSPQLTESLQSVLGEAINAQFLMPVSMHISADQKSMYTINHMSLNFEQGNGNSVPAIGYGFGSSPTAKELGAIKNVSPLDLYSINLQDDFVAHVPGLVLQATRSVLVTQNGGATNNQPSTPMTPSIQPPFIVSTTQPVTQQTQPPAGSSTSTPKPSEIEAKPVVSSLQKAALKKAEKDLLSPSLFAVAQINTKRLFAKLPLPAIKSVPYILYLALLSLAGYYLYQTQKQLRREERVRVILKRQQVLTEEKRNFLELTSHYLRTPLTYIRSGAEMSSRKTGNEQLAADMSQAVNHLSLFIESLIEEAGTEKNQEALKEVKIKSPLLSRNFLLPTLGLVGASGIFYLLASGLAGITFASTAYFTHVVLTILIIRLFYGMLKNHRLVLAEKNQMSAILKAERELDHARSKLLEDAGEQLKTRTDHISGLSTQLTDDDTSKKIIQQGVERLQELSRAFRLVCKLEAQALVPQMKPVTAEALASEVIEPFKDQLAEKKLTLNVTGFTENVILTTNKPLAQLTLRSLIENAIQASEVGDALVVKCLHSDGHTAFQVIDHGEGIPKEKIAQLFKPFVRVGPVTTFNREGIGLSLFLDRLIMHSLGGEVEIMSKFEQGTVATLTFATETAQ